TTTLSFRLTYSFLFHLSPHPYFLPFLLYRPSYPLLLPSFPTRRSSDLLRPAWHAVCSDKASRYETPAPKTCRSDCRHPSIREFQSNHQRPIAGPESPTEPA